MPLLHWWCVYKPAAISPSSLIQRHNPLHPASASPLSPLMAGDGQPSPPLRDLTGHPYKDQLEGLSTFRRYLRNLSLALELNLNAAVSSTISAYLKETLPAGTRGPSKLHVQPEQTQETVGCDVSMAVTVEASQEDQPSGSGSGAGHQIHHDNGALDLPQCGDTTVVNTPEPLTRAPGIIGSVTGASEAAPPPSVQESGDDINMAAPATYEVDLEAGGQPTQPANDDSDLQDPEPSHPLKKRKGPELQPIDLESSDASKRRKLRRSRREDRIENRKDILLRRTLTDKAAEKPGGSTEDSRPDVKKIENSEHVARKNKLEELLKSKEIDIWNYLGKGGFGSVYSAVHEQFGEVAVKVMRKDAAYRYPDGRESIRRELWVMKRVAHKKNSQTYLVPLLQSFDNDEWVFIVMPQYADSLENYLVANPGRHMSWHQIRQICSQLIFALAELQMMKVIHRDIKPDNILFDKHGDVAIADYGVASIRNEEFAALRPDCGAGCVDGYKAPELNASPDAHTYASDIYALGVVFLQLMTGSAYPNTLFQPGDQYSSDQLKDHLLRTGIRGLPDLQAENMIRRMLEPIPKNRITIKELMKHPFFGRPDFSMMSRKRIIPATRSGDACHPSHLLKVRSKEVKRLQRLPTKYLEENRKMDEENPGEFLWVKNDDDDDDDDEEEEEEEEEKKENEEGGNEGRNEGEGGGALPVVERSEISH
ncbi:kinase-like domain-containing protein [Cristinia sonorae]|uniref:mitogen-activated protein kinase kinase n=1 Tax=Cristinia sonorae TaxID=1940300 RepID=A0A8K0UDR5_9AGAR|nr:kinase-like domain-containing protein [Cristinia sonorae]